MAIKKAPGLGSLVHLPVKSSKPAAKSAPKPAPQSKAALRDDERVEVDELARRAANSDAATSAFNAQLSPADAEKRGRETKAAGVVKDARAWVPIIAKALSAGSNVRYSASRFVHFLGCVDALARALDGVAQGGAGKARSLAESRARQARNLLLESLEEVVLGNDDAEAALHEARGETTSADSLVVSLRSLVAFAEKWLAKRDAGSKALVESAGLTEADVSLAVSAADALAASSKGKTLAGVERKTDTAETNRLEGRVTFEMGVAMRAFNAAAERGQGVKLTPGPATRRVLLSKPGKEKVAPQNA